jgi:hypothetical protein
MNNANNLHIVGQEAVNAWHNIMPNSSISHNILSLGNTETLYIRLYLGADKSEFPNGYAENDPLAYTIQIDKNLTYTESASSLYIKPPIGSNLVYGRVNMRRKTIKDISPSKFEKRFNEIKLFIIDNRANLTRLAFNIDEKLI